VRLTGPLGGSGATRLATAELPLLRDDPEPEKGRWRWPSWEDSREELGRAVWTVTCSFFGFYGLVSLWQIIGSKYL
jgi:hypothetical protein